MIKNIFPLLAALLIAVGASLALKRGVEWDRPATEESARQDLARLREGVAAALKEGAPLDVLQEPPVLWGARLGAVMPHEPNNALSLRSDRKPSDTGYWAYDRATGRVYIDCTHTDSRGTVWTAY